jgi:hypothetical protein
MFGKVFHTEKSPEGEMRRLLISMSSKKPVTLNYITTTGEQIILAKETTSFKGEIGVPIESESIQCRFEGENIKSKRNVIKLEIAY